MRRLLAGVIALAGCIDPHLVACPGTDLVCPTGTVCDALHAQCLAPDQLTACDGLADGATCSAGKVGYCKDGVCLFAECGNRYVDPGEACDDGNHADHDGCNATCTSTEICGNGFVDPGETCDDGNAVAGDGCDSLCHPEVERWTLEPLLPVLSAAFQNGAYDAAHHQLVAFDGELTWTWNGTDWAIAALESAPTFGWMWYALVGDPELGVVRIGETYDGSHPFAVWTGSSWAPRAFIGPVPSLDALESRPPRIAYDAARHVAIVAGSDTDLFASVFAIDVAAGTWAALPTPPGADVFASQELEFDAAHGTIVLVGTDYTAAAKTWTWDGAAWSAAAATPIPAFDGVMAYDPSRASVLVIGGSPDGSPSTAVYTWTGTAWVAGPDALPQPRMDGFATYDADRARVVVIGPGLAHAVLELDASWHVVSPQVPTSAGTATYDLARRAIVLLCTDPDVAAVDAWVWDGHWRAIEAAPPAIASGPPPIAYDPIRAASVVAAADGSTWLLAAEHWQPLAAAGTGPTALYAVAFDPVRRAVVGFDGTGTWALPSDSAAWARIANPPMFLGTTLAFDASTSSLVTLSRFDTEQLEHDAWIQDATPGTEYTIVANQRRGDIELVRADGDTWERVHGAWIQHAPLPHPVTGIAVYAGDTGALVILGMLGNSYVVLRRIYAGASPLESCAAGDDLDGDGLSGCDDPDCWWRCTPACPPETSC